MENQKMINYEAQPNYRHVGALIAAVLFVVMIPVLILSIYAVTRENKIEIVDNLTEDGTLRLDLNEEMVATLAAAEKVEYIWQKSVNGGDFENVEEVSFEGGETNIGFDDQGYYLNVALDGGELNDDQASVAYRMEVVYGTTSGVRYYTGEWRVMSIMPTEEDLDGKKGYEVVQSEEFYVPYYEELRNGSFETPTVGGTGSMQFGNEEYAGMGGVWQSTSEVYNNWYKKDVAVEIVNAANTNAKGERMFATGYSWYGDGGALSGDQFAELNCESAGALYQDVMTIPGEGLNYWLGHRARGQVRSEALEYDTMYLVIMPTSEALTAANGGELDTQAELQSYLAGLGVDITENYSEVGYKTVYGRNGILVVRVTSSDQAWQYVSAIDGYVPTGGVTRFFFVAGATASGNNTVGNFLDEVGFSQEVPPIAEELFSLQVEKTITGISEAELETLVEENTLTVSAYDADGDEVATALDGYEIEYEEMNWSGSESEGWTGTYTIANQEVDENVEVYTVEDPETAVEGYEVESTPVVEEGSEVATASFVPSPSQVSTVSFSANLTAEGAETETEEEAEGEGSGGAGDEVVTEIIENLVTTSGDGTNREDEVLARKTNGLGVPDTGMNQVIGTSNATMALAYALAVSGLTALLVAMAPRMASTRKAAKSMKERKTKF